MIIEEEINLKEATGELNMTVVTIVAIGVLIAFFYAVIWPGIKSSIALTSACNASNGESYDQTDEKSGVHIHCDNGTCYYDNADGSTSKVCAKDNK